MSKEKKHNKLYIAGATVAVCVAAIYVRRKNRNISVTEYIYESSKLPKSFDGYQIVQLSDLQSRSFGSGQRDLLHTVSEEKPDLILITGNLLNGRHANYAAARAAVKGLVEMASVYYVNGSHEMKLPKTAMWEYYGELLNNGVHVLFDAADQIYRGDEHIRIIGISEYTTTAGRELGKEAGIEFYPQVLTEQIDELTDGDSEEFTLMLTHESRYLDYYAGSGVDLTFAGNGHGGMLSLPGGQKFMPSITPGMHKKGSSSAVISRGLTNSEFPYMMGNRPEIVSLTLRCV